MTRVGLGCHGSSDVRLLHWGDVFTLWAGERQVLYDLPPPRIEDLLEDLPVPPWHRSLKRAISPEEWQPEFMATKGGAPS